MKCKDCRYYNSQAGPMVRLCEKHLREKLQSMKGESFNTLRQGLRIPNKKQKEIK